MTKEHILNLLGERAKEFGMTRLSRATGIDRCHLYLIFKNGNPQLDTLMKVCDSLGVKLRISFEK